NPDGLRDLHDAEAAKPHFARLIARIVEEAIGVGIAVAAGTDDDGVALARVRDGLTDRPTGELVRAAGQAVAAVGFDVQHARVSASARDEREDTRDEHPSVSRHNDTSPTWAISASRLRRDVET